MSRPGQGRANDVHWRFAIAQFVIPGPEAGSAGAPSMIEWFIAVPVEVSAIFVAVVLLLSPDIADVG